MLRLYVYCQSALPNEKEEMARKGTGELKSIHYVDKSCQCAAGTW